MLPCVPTEPERPVQARRARYQERVWKCNSFSKPPFNPQMHNLPLLFHRFAKFNFRIVLQPAPEDLQNFRRGFAAGTNNKNAIESPLVFRISFREFNLDDIACQRSLLLLQRRPGRGASMGRLRSARLADPRMAAKSFIPRCII